jgi:hypothetical protein
MAGHFGGNNVEQQLLPLMLTPFRASQVSEVCLSAPVSTLLTASSVVILPAPILKPKWVQYKKQHRKVDARELTVVHLTGACISQGHASYGLS